MNPTSLLACAALALTPPAAPQEAAPPPREPVVSVELLADVAALQPGATFQLAAFFELPKHWHIYWENAGESGMATTVKVTAPEGFQVGETRYPGPKSLEVGLEVTSFVYEDQVALFVPVTAPAALDPEAHYTFKLSAQWLVCQEVCFLQSKDLELELGVFRGEGAPEPANAERLAPQLARLPRPQAEFEALMFQWLPSKPEYRARIVVKGARDAEFFPGLETNLVVTRVVDNPGGNAFEFAVDFIATAGQEDEPPIASGVMRVVDAQGERFFSVSFAPAVEEPAVEDGSR